MMRLFFLSVIFIVLFGCSSSSTVSTSETSQAITAATLSYVKNHSAVSSAKVKVDSIVQSGNYARARVVTTESITDPAFVFLTHTSQGWQVISLGTAFDQTFYKQYHIPNELKI